SKKPALIEYMNFTKWE
ncbi:unnamed protein product, partial [Allacma fusca]